MAYSVDLIASVTNATHSAGRTNDDIANSVDTTSCHTNGTVGESCDEFKDAESMKIGLDVSGGQIENGSKVQVYCNDVMSAGDVYLLPYSDANSVIGTNELGPETIGAGAYDEFTLDQNFIDDLAAPDGNGYVYVRYASDGTAKSKTGEVQADLIVTLDTLAGITKDNAGDVLVSCYVACFQKVEGGGPPHEYVWVASTTSHGTTGAYSFSVAPSGEFFVYAIKEDTPHVFDVTDDVLTGV